MRVPYLRQCKRRLQLSMCVLAMAAGPAWAQAPRPAASHKPTPEQRLASEAIRSAMTTAAVNPLTSEALDIACILAREAVTLDPENVGIWRLALNIAMLGEREDLRDACIDAISRLDPADEVIRLQRINLALDRYPTVEGRAAAYENLLDSDNIPRLGPATASRLALDLALLKQRLGDIDGFTKWLTKSLELDRSNRSAAALAAGFFQANVADPVGRAELLVNLITADPTDIQTQVTLAQSLLESGAYVGSVRIYSAALNGMRVSRISATTELLADFAIAQWAAGDIEGALETIDRRQAEIDEVFRAEKGREDEDLTMVQIGELKGPIDPMLATVVAVIHADRRDAQAGAAVAAAIAAGETDIAAAGKLDPPVDAADMAARHLHLAWLQLWLGDDPAKAAEHIAAADALQPMTDQIRSRFEGWQALKKGEVARAIELLTPLIEEDSLSRVGLALALKADGRGKDAARELLALNTSQPGSMIGIWAAGELAQILGQRLPLSKSAADLERLIASLPRTFDRYPVESSMAIALRTTLANPNPSAFDPLLITVQLTNLTSMPLALDRDGPLRPQVLVEPKVNTSVPLTGAPKAFIIDLDSRLRLAPRETVSLTFDLRWFEVGDLMNLIASAGAIVRLTLDCNFIATPDGTIEPGLFGIREEAPLIRQDGVRDNNEWVANTLASIKDPVADPDVRMVHIALLANQIMIAGKDLSLAEDRRNLMLQAKSALPEAYAQLDDTRQAWTLAVMTRAGTVDGVLDIARKSESRLVRLAYLMSHLQSDEDPMLDAALRGEDEPLRTIADRIRSQAANAKAKAGAATAPSP